MLEAFCIGGFIKGPGWAQIIAVKDPGRIPGKIKDINGGARNRLGYFEDAFVEPDGGIVVDAAFSVHTEQASDIGDLGQFSAGVVGAESFLKRTYA